MKSFYKKIIIVVTFFLAGSSCIDIYAQSNVVPDEVEFAALKAIYDSLGGTNWTTKTNWPTFGNWPATATAAQMGTWYGVTVVNGDVTKITFTANNLIGFVPTHVGNLLRLEMMTFARDKGVGGAIPSTIGNLLQLKSVNFAQSNLSRIPASLFNLPSLTSLALHENNISGALPYTMGNATSLVSLTINNNKLSGSIPPSIGALINLTSAKMQYNAFTGVIPSTIGTLVKLTYLSIDNNQLTGTIPASIGNLTKLTVLSLKGNQLSGSIPDEIGNLVELQTLGLFRNQLSGAIPSSISALTKLTLMDLSSNQLTGTIPDTFGGLTLLGQLLLNSNKLSGEIPSSLSGISNLAVLALNDNQLSGPVPESIGNLTKLSSLYLQLNQLGGTLPSSLGGLSKLQNLYLNDNQLSGSLPAAFNGMVKLQMLMLYNNQFSGNISFLNFPELTQIQLYNNAFTGAFPSLPKLNYLNAINNQFTSLPSSLLGNSQMTYINVSNNELTSIPNFATHPNKAFLALVLSNNQLDFSHLEPLVGGGLKSVGSLNQKTIKDQLGLSFVIGSPLVITARPTGSFSTVSWEKRGANGQFAPIINDQDSNPRTYTRTSATSADQGVYRWKMTNSKVTSFTLYSDPITITIDTPYPVLWSDMINSEITSGNTLTKTGLKNDWDAGASSYNLLAANTDGYVQFTYNGQAGDALLGLSSINAAPGYSSVNYGIYMSSGSTAAGLYVYEKGINIDYFGTLSVGDVLKVAREGLSMNYYKNDVLFHSTSITSSSIELQADAALYTSGYILPAVTVSFNTRLLFLKPSYTFPSLANNDGGLSVLAEGGTSPYTYTWSSGELTSSISGKPRGNYTVTATDAVGRSVTSTYYLGYPVAWTNLEHVTLNNTGSLTRHSSSDWWAGGSSLNVLPGGSNGYLEFAVTDILPSFMIGLSDFDPNANYTSIDFAIYTDGNLLYTSISGAIDVFGSFKKGDVFRIAREGGQIVFYRNNIPFHTSSVAVSAPLLADVSVYTALGNVPVITTSFEKQIRFKPVFTFPDALDANGSIAVSVSGAYSPTSITWMPTGEAGYLITGKKRAAYTATVTDAASRTSSKTYRLGYPVSWTDLQNAKLNEDNTLSLTNGIAWSGGATSTNFLPGHTDGWMEFIVGRGLGDTMMGLARMNSSPNYASIDYAFNIRNASTLYIYEAGVERGFFGYLQEGDVISMARVGSAINYYLNGSMILSTPTTPSDVLVVDTSLNSSLIVTTPVITSSFGRGAQTFYSVSDGNWNNLSTWSLSESGPVSSVYPAIGDVVNIKGFSVTVNTEISTSDINVIVTNDNTSLKVEGSAGELKVKGEVHIQGTSNIKTMKAVQVQNEGKLVIENPD